MEDREFGYQDNPANGLGIVRARTLIGNLRLWDFPRSEEALAIIIDETGQSPIPGIYLLFDENSGKKVYIGESENLEARLKKHIKTPEDKIKNWNRAFIINDARNASWSDINDQNIRLALENYLVRLFKTNKHKVTTSSSRSPSLSAIQNTLVKSFKKELDILLLRKNKITQSLREDNSLLVFPDKTEKILKAKGHKVENLKDKEALIDDQQTLIRDGSQKPKGWQVTFRGNTSKPPLEAGTGYLLMRRGPILLIPLSVVKNFISSKDSTAFNRETIDIFIRFAEKKIFLVYKKSEQEITAHAIQDYPLK